MMQSGRVKPQRPEGPQSGGDSRDGRDYEPFGEYVQRRQKDYPYGASRGDLARIWVQERPVFQDYPGGQLLRRPWGCPKRKSVPDVTHDQEMQYIEINRFDEVARLRTIYIAFLIDFELLFRQSRFRRPPVIRRGDCRDKIITAIKQKRS